jgi:hypothetical protein
MKKLLITTAITMACVGAFAQGKITFGNNDSHLIVFTADAGMLPTAYKSLAGLPVPQLGTTANTFSFFTAELVYGVTAGTMNNIYSVAAGQAGFSDGRLANKNINLTAGTVAGGSTGFFQVRVYETAAGSWLASQGGEWVSGYSPVFTVVAGSTLNNSIVLAGAPSLSTWAAGNVQLTMVPEPSTMALAGLGAAALLIFRRRK